MSLLLLNPPWCVPTPVAPEPPTFTGPGPNAPDWADAFSSDLRFATPIPEYPAASVDGVRGHQGFGTAYLGEGFDRTSYVTAETPDGLMTVLDIEYPGQRETITTVGQATPPWRFKGSEYTQASVRVVGTYVGKLAFKQSTDNGATWTSIAGIGQRPSSEGVYYSPNGSSFTRTVDTVRTSELWTFTTDATAKLLRVEAEEWTSGTATIDVGMTGGQSPARANFGNFPANQSRIYGCMQLRLVPGPNGLPWASNGNLRTKLLFPRFTVGSGNASNHVLMLTEAATGDMRQTVQLQENSFASAVASQGFPFGPWTRIEFIFVMNTPGVADGVAQVWVNGIQVVDWHTVRWCEVGDTPAWSYLWLDPTFGAGANPPFGQRLQIASFYRRSAA